MALDLCDTDTLGDFTVRMHIKCINSTGKVESPYDIFNQLINFISQTEMLVLSIASWFTQLKREMAHYIKYYIKTNILYPLFYI